MKNKTALYLSVTLLLLSLLGGFFIIKKLSQKPVVQPEEEEEVVSLPEADENIEVDLVAVKEGRAVVLSVSNIPEGTLSVEYELSYLTGKGLPKGALGKVDLIGDTELRREILLGTCSKNVCTYDEGVESVSLVLRFNHPDGATQYTNDFTL